MAPYNWIFIVSTTGLFSTANIELMLSRFPKDQASNLQAWDASDEHIVKHLVENEFSPQNTLVVNDTFGALSCSLKKIDTNWPITTEIDNKTSLLGLEQNLADNQLPSVTTINSVNTLPANLSLVLMKIPKNLTYFAYQLQRLSHVLDEGTQVFISAKAKLINKALIEVINKNLGEASASLAWKKTRLITCIADGKARPITKSSKWNVPEYKLDILNHPNVFASNKLDIGARIMLDNLPQGEFRHVVDLGCGNGILGLRASQIYPNANIHFVDDSFMAVKSSEDNWKINQLPNDKGHFYWNDCLGGLTFNADLVLCNPPFHQGEAITDHIAWQMFVDAYHCLNKGGVLHIVGNRHLAYHVKLKRIFKNCTTVASNGKFVILQAIKQS